MTCYFGFIIGVRLALRNQLLLYGTCWFFLFLPARAANSGCVADGSVHDAGAAAVHPGRVGRQGDRRGPETTPRRRRDQPTSGGRYRVDGRAVLDALDR